VPAALWQSDWCCRGCRTSRSCAISLRCCFAFALSFCCTMRSRDIDSLSCTLSLACHALATWPQILGSDVRLMKLLAPCLLQVMQDRMQYSSGMEVIVEFRVQVECWKCGDARDKLEPRRWDAWRGRWTLCGCANAPPFHSDQLCYASLIFMNCEPDNSPKCRQGRTYKCTGIRCRRRSCQPLLFVPSRRCSSESGEHLEVNASHQNCALRE
jgi:hypothetical protein